MQACKHAGTLYACLQTPEKKNRFWRKRCAARVGQAVEQEKKVVQSCQNGPVFGSAGNKNRPHKPAGWPWTTSHEQEQQQQQRKETEVPDTSLYNGHRMRFFTSAAAKIVLEGGEGRAGKVRQGKARYS
mmetsp:Transcript_6602/g.9662  ORF Transcript_6602/g.9662 Transcript_6602/m.9662 type:complete len:129 (+) Transcript_6602:281-667(+)